MCKKLLFRRIERQLARYLKKHIPKEEFIDDFKIDIHIAAFIKLKIPRRLKFEEAKTNSRFVTRMYQNVDIADVGFDFRYYEPERWYAEALGLGYRQDEELNE
jgi:hypothetical protein